MGEMGAYSDVDGPLFGGAEEILAMIARFYDGGVEGGGGIIDAERAIAEARPGRIEVRECSHDRRGAGPRNTILGGDQADVADLIAHAIVRKAFDDEDVLKVCREIGRASWRERVCQYV